ncbi:IS1341-type transposase (TCE32) [Halosimplex carlsbadense 2-9-1]|uniref:IS1341-type transposase (TCE32) n=1 Tax=Halosimplex carlsbadense 2-9-1 TaxID=797114 RepID=M0CES8_9EURY|nr:IS1341-type transposase (TCE32) [Halosimplex carlsbadense 2-9-1]
MLGGATAQAMIKRNESAWQSFFALLDDPSEDPSPPGYWGNEEDGRTLQTYVRNDAYDIQWGERSRLDIRVGQDLKEEFEMGYYERLRLDVRGNPHWDGKSGRLTIEYDDIDDTFRVYQPVTVAVDPGSESAGDEIAALDLGVNTLVACSTTTGRRYLYHGRDLFERFRETTEEIARLRNQLEDGQNTSRRIRRLYRTRSRRRDHAVDACVRDLVERLSDCGIRTVVVGDLSADFPVTGSSRANEMVHNFWSYGELTDQLRNVCEEQGITVESRSEAGTSQQCPDCGQAERTCRHQSTLTCACGFEGHADLVASRNLLTRRIDNRTIARPMARPVRFQWDNHEWRSTTDASQSPTNSARTRKMSL